MRLKVFCVFDAAASAYLPPFFMRARGEAIRAFAAAANSADHAFAKHADDYVLFEIGEFDDASGTFEATTPSSLGSAVEYVEKYKAPAAPAPTPVDPRQLSLVEDA